MGPRSPASIHQDLEWGSWLRSETDKALESGDDERASDLLFQQQSEAFRSLVEVALEGGDPFTQTTPRAAFVPPEIEANRRAVALARREMNVERALSESQWNTIEQFKQQTIEAWHARNEAPLEQYREGMGPEEMQRLAEQVRPMVLNPDEVANYHQILAQANAALRKIDPSLNVFSHPKTAAAAHWLMSEGQGSFVRPESARPYDYGAGLRDYMPEFVAQQISRTGHVAQAAFEGLTYLPYHLVEGTSALAMTALSNLGGEGTDYWNIPTQALVDNTGEVVHNGGKVSPEIGLQLNLWHRAVTNELQQNYIQDAQAWERNQRHGVQWLISGVAHLGGSLVGFGPAAKAWQWGSKGARAARAGAQQMMPGLMKGLAEVTGGTGARATRIRDILVDTVGAAVAGGMVDTVSFGKHEGVAKSFTHGLISTPLYLALGAIGRKVEGSLPARMPERVKRAIGGAAEGFGLGMLENHQLTPLWHFIREPTADNWNAYAATLTKNILGMALIKGGGRAHGGPFQTPETLGRDLGMISDLEGAIRSTAREAATTQDPARQRELIELAERQGYAAEDFLELGRLNETESVSRGTSPADAGAAREAGNEKRIQMERRKQGVDRPDAEREAESWQAKREQGTGPFEKTADQKIEEARAEAIPEGFTPERWAELQRLAAESGDVVGKPKSAEEMGTDLEALMKADEGEAAGGMSAERMAELQRLAEASGDVIGKPKSAEEMGADLEALMKADEGEAARLTERLGEGDEAPPMSNRNFPASGGSEHYEGRGERAPKITDFDLVMRGNRPRKGIFGIGKREGDPIQIPFRTKGFNGRGIRGYLETRQDIIRSQEAYDLNNRAHEWSHAMQKKTIGLSKHDLAREFSKEALDEMVEIGQAMWGPRDNVSRRMAEGFAEFFSRDLLGDRELQQNYPNLYNEAMTWLTDPVREPLANQYRRIKDLYTRWREAGAVERAISTILPEPGTKKPSEAERAAAPGAREKLEAFFGDLLNDTAAFHRAYKTFMEAAGHDPSKVPIMYRPGDLTEVLKMTAPRIAESWIKLGITDLAGNLVKGTKSLDSILKQLTAEELDNFWAYLKRRRELEMMDAGITNVGVDRAEAQFVVDRLGSEKFETVAREITEWFHAIIDYVGEAGGLSYQQTEVIKDAYMAYMPFHRVAPWEVGYRKGKSPVAGQGSGIKTVKGSDLPILDPLVAMQKMAVSLAIRAQKAQIMRAMFDHMHLNEGQGGFVTDVTGRYLAKDVKIEDIAKALENAELPGDLKHEMETAVDTLRQLADGNLDAITLFSMSMDPQAGKPVIAHTVHRTHEQMLALYETKREMLAGEGLSGDALTQTLNQFMERVLSDQGNVRLLEVDTAAYNLLMGVEGGTTMLDSLPRWMQVMFTAPAKAVRLGATTLSLPFVLRNLNRDASQQQLFTKNPSLIPFAGYKALFDGMRTEADVKGWINRMGGAGITFVGGEVTGPKIGKDMSRISEESGGLGAKLRGWVKNWADFIGESEQWLRRLEAQKVEKMVMEKRGDRPGAQLEARLEALLAAKEVTVNFTRSSAFTRAMNQVFPYFNPGMQGTRKWVRRSLGYEGKEEQKQFWIQGLKNITAMSALSYLFHGDEDWYQDLPTWRRLNYWSFKGPDGTVVHMPKPFEVGTLFTVPFEMMADSATGKEQKLTIKDFAFEMSKGFLNNHQLLPAALLPVAENVGNYSFFRGRSIVPEWMERSRMPKDQYDRYTSETAKWLGEAMNYSPAKIENAISGYTGGAGLQLMRALDGFEVAGRKKWPLVSSFLSERHQSGYYTQELYRIGEDIEQAFGSEEMTRAQASFRPQVRAAKERLREIRRAAEAGKLDSGSANRQAYELSKRVVDSYNKAVR